MCVRKHNRESEREREKKEKRKKEGNLRAAIFAASPAKCDLLNLV